MNKTITLANAKRLHEVCKEKGVELEDSQYLFHKKTEERIIFNTEMGTIQFDMEEFIPAYDTNELLEILPRYIKLNVRKHLLPQKHLLRVYKPSSGGYGARYDAWKSCDKYKEKCFRAETPQDALCQLLIFLIDNNIYQSNE